MRAWRPCERAWGPVASVRAWPGASVRAWPGASVHAWPSACLRGDPGSEWAWGPSACVHGDQVGVGTWCEHARWAPQASGRRDPVRACVHGPCKRAGVGTRCKQACMGPVHVCVGPVRVCVRTLWGCACVDPAGMDMGVWGPGKDDVVVILRARKHSVCKKITRKRNSLTYEPSAGRG